MKYKSTGTLTVHKVYVRQRETAFDKNFKPKDSSFSSFEDHKEMKTYEYAAFQKKVFKEKRRQKRKYHLIILLTVIAAAIILFFIPTVLNLIFN
mgnify:CR=1 FL=1